ncbi:MAG: hypothetical protein KDA73_03595 [Rhodobacteraceae bacterium]|nr:hypothetical protein [Paracoccaceae bacterium]
MPDVAADRQIARTSKTKCDPDGNVFGDRPADIVLTSQSRNGPTGDPAIHQVTFIPKAVSKAGPD